MCVLVHSLYFLWVLPFRGSDRGTDRLRTCLSFPGAGVKLPQPRPREQTAVLLQKALSNTLSPGSHTHPPTCTSRPETGLQALLSLFPPMGLFVFSRRPSDLTNFIASAVGAGLTFFPTSFYSFQLIELSKLKAKLHTSHPSPSAVPTSFPALAVP